MTTNAPLLNQHCRRQPAVARHEQSPGRTNTTWGSNGVVTLGMTNQWHFYVVTNTGAGADFTNAAFITFIPSTLAIPRMGRVCGSAADATRPSADIDLYVAGPNDPNASGLTNLDPTVISNCLAGANGDGASLSRGGTEFVVYTNSVSIAANSGAPSVIILVCIRKTGGGGIWLHSHLHRHSLQPARPNGSQIVNGLNVPVNIPDDNLGHPASDTFSPLSCIPWRSVAS